MSHLNFDRDETVRLLRDSMTTLASAARGVPPEYTHANPDWYAPDEWTVALNIAHLAIYETALASPVLAAIAAGGDGEGVVESGLESWFLPRTQELARQPLDVLVERLRDAREEHISIAQRLDPSRWNEPVTPLWNFGRHGTGTHSPAWVAMKTFQHTWEHGNAVLRMSLFAPRR